MGSSALPLYKHWRQVEPRAELDVCKSCSDHHSLSQLLPVGIFLQTTRSKDVHLCARGYGEGVSRYASFTSGVYGPDKRFHRPNQCTRGTSYEITA